MASHADPGHMPGICAARLRPRMAAIERTGGRLVRRDGPDADHDLGARGPTPLLAARARHADRLR